MNLTFGSRWTLLSAAALMVSAAAQAQTFTKDVAPIVQRSCQTCHRPDSIGPFSMLTYEEARPWAKAIKEDVIKRQMPPFYLDKNVGITHIKNDISLSDAEIATIAKWVDAGAPKGDPADMPPPRKFEDNDRWHFQPDLVVKLPADMVMPARAADWWKDIVVDPG